MIHLRSTHCTGGRQSLSDNAYGIPIRHQSCTLCILALRTVSRSLETLTSPMNITAEHLLVLLRVCNAVNQQRSALQVTRSLHIHCTTPPAKLLQATRVEDVPHPRIIKRSLDDRCQSSKTSSCVNGGGSCSKSRHCHISTRWMLKDSLSYVLQGDRSQLFATWANIRHHHTRPPLHSPHLSMHVLRRA